MKDEGRRASRDAIRNDRFGGDTRPRNLWALIVGISEYQDSDISNLEFAHTDADALYEHLTDPRCGGYPPSQIRKLTNAQATREEILDGLYTFLRQPGRDDFVVVFFACHGGPDPERPDDLYVFPYDTKRKRLPATAIDMERVQEALSARKLLAERVVLLADTCHAGGFNRGHRSADAADAMNRFMHSMAKSRPGMATLTAAEEREVAHEGTEWGGGHGVFTHYLLKGLKEDAARPEDGVVTIGQLFEYVRSKVVEATSPDRVQHPHFTLNGDAREWPMAIVSDLFADERYKLGRALSVVGQRLGDDRRLEVAIDEHTAAIALAQQVGRALPSARYEIGRCLLAAGEFDRAVAELEGAAEDARAEAAGGRSVTDGLVADIRFWAWAAALQSRDPAATERATSRFLDAHAGDPRATLVNTMSRLRSLRRQALLIGIDFSGRGPSNDVEDVHQLLLDSGYAEIQILNTKETTTRQAIFEALDAFRQAVVEDEEVLIYLAGHSVRRSAPGGSTAPGVVLCASDSRDKDPDSFIQADELHRALSSLSARQVLVVIDSCYGGGLLDQPRSSESYALLSGTNSYQESEERTADGVRRGIFSKAFVAALRGLVIKGPSADDIINAIRREMLPGRQLPIFLGSEGAQVLQHLQEAARICAALGYSQREYLGRCSRGDLERLTTGLTPEIRGALPGLCNIVGRACLDKRMYEMAAQQFEIAADLGKAADLGIDRVATHLGHAISLSHLGDYTAAERAFVEGASLLEQDGLAACRAALAKLQGGRVGRALLVGVSRAHPDTREHYEGVINDVRSMRRALEGFHDTIEIAELLGEQATRDAVLDQFRDLVARSAEVPCLFFFAGPGNQDGEPALVTFRQSWRHHGEIRLQELSEIAGPRAKNLISIIDAGWIPPAELPWLTPNSSRCESSKHRMDIPAGDWVVPAPSPNVLRPQEAISYRDVEVPEVDVGFPSRRAQRTNAVAHLGIGMVTIYNSCFLMRMCPEGAETGENVVEAELPLPWEGRRHATQGVLTHAIAAALSMSSRQCSYRQLQELGVSRLQWLQPVFLGTCPEERFMSNVVLEDEFERVLRKVSLDKPLFEAVTLLEARLQRLESMKDGSEKDALLCAAYRELGIACLSTGDVEQAIAALERALNAGGLRDPEVRAYLGRALVEQGDDLDAAVSHLQEAIALWAPGEPPEHVDYYYGRALRERMETQRRQDSERLRQAWQRYLTRGAPLGHRSEVEAFFARPSR